MRLGIGTYTFGWRVGVEGSEPSVPMDEVILIDEARRAEIKLVQLGDNLPLHTFSVDRRIAFLDKIQKSNVAIELGAKGMTEMHLRKYILLCAEMKSSLLRFLVDDQSFTPQLREIEQIIRSQIPLLQEWNVALALENHDRIKASEWCSLIENIGCEHVGICLDTANSLSMGEGIESIIEILAPYTLNLHLKDFIITRLSHKMGFLIEGCPAGTGLLDIPHLLIEIDKYRKCRTAILEQWTVPESTIEGTIKKESKWASDSLKYLKPLFNTEHILNESS